MTLLSILASDPENNREDACGDGGTVFGEEPHPWVLIVWESGDQAYEKQAIESRKSRATKIAERIAELAPTRAVVSSKGLRQVHTASFDLIVAIGSFNQDYLGHSDVIQFGGSKVGVVTSSVSPVVKTALAWNRTSYAHKWVIPSNLDPDVEGLVKSDLLPLVPRGTVIPEAYRGSGIATLSVPSRDFGDHPHQVFLEDIDGLMLAMCHQYNWDSGDEPRLHWVLPAAANELKWIPVVLRRLNEIRPEKYPIRTSWAEIDSFQTIEERRARKDILNLDTAADAYMARYKNERAELVSRLETATTRAETGPRRMVTSQGQELLIAVSDALRAFGFSVTSSDGGAERGDRLEDLIVRLDESSGWVALVEVRGYVRGAQLGDLQRIGRFVARYQQKNAGSLPDRRWYIVNHSLKSSPEDRMMALASNPSEVEIFAEDAGLVIDTAELLRLAILVESGAISVSAARRALCDATGYFSADVGETA